MPANAIPMSPYRSTLPKGELKQVSFYGRGLQTIATRYNVRHTEDGNTIYFDDSFRQRIVLVNQDWERLTDLPPRRESE